MSTGFNHLHGLPNGFFDLKPASIRRLFPQPTLIQLDGENPRPLFIKILLHGNEHTGLTVMQRLLRQHGHQLPRSILLFVGNVRAAEVNRRLLPDQEDYNRCWPGTPHGPSATTVMMQQIFERVRALQPFAAVDLHNNTGRNPHYACITDTRLQNRFLAARFNRVAMVIRRQGISTMAFDGICPAVTLECGMPGNPSGIDAACQFIEDLLSMEYIADTEPTHEALQLVSSKAMLTIPDKVSFAFDPTADADLRFESNFEDRNFTPFSPDEVFGYTRVAAPLKITDDQGQDITKAIIRIEAERIYLNQSAMPAMITSNQEVVRQDCLCYLLQDYPG